MQEYLDGIIFDWYVNLKPISNEIITVISGGKSILSGIPDYFNKVSINGYFEKTEGELSENNFRVNYLNGQIFFHPSKEGQQIEISSYQSRGQLLYPASRIYDTASDEDVVVTIQDLIDAGREALSGLDLLEGAITAAEIATQAAIEAADNANNVAVEFNEAENNRVIAENNRESNENIRISNEDDRISKEIEREQNETVRQTNETARESDESQRQINEADRINKENVRAENENIRQSNETTRVENETTRQSAEAQRELNELDRIEKENTRGANEDIRISAETARVEAESSRQDNENVREDNEVTREQNESTRITKENDREDNEATRIVKENERISSESNRATNESQRQEKEGIRVDNEIIREQNEATRINKEDDRIDAENIRIANEANREQNESDRQQAELDRETSINRLVHLGEYDPNTVYFERNIVNLLGSGYMSIKDDFSGIPPTDTTYWKLLAKKGDKGANLSYKGTFNELDSYEINDLVLYDGSLYACIQPTTGDLPDELNSQYWEMFLSGGGDMSRAVYDTNYSGKVDMAEDSEKLGGQLPEYYEDLSNQAEQNSKYYTDQQIALVTETGIPKLQVYTYKYNDTPVGTSDFEIPLETFDKNTDVIKMYINRIPLDDDYYMVVNSVYDEGVLIEHGKVTLNSPLTEASKVIIEIWKNIPIGEDGSVSGTVIAINSLPQNRIENVEDFSKRSELEAHKSNLLLHTPYAVASGTTDYSISVPGIATLTEGLCLKVKFVNANTGAVTLNVNELGAVAIQKSNGNSLSSDNIKANQIVHLVYTGSVFQLLGEGGEYGTATAVDVLAGKTIGTEAGLIMGAMPDRGDVSVTLTDQGQQYTIQAGKHDGTGKVTVNMTNLTEANIKDGVLVGGVEGTFTDDATATVAQILTGQTAYKAGAKLTGAMPNRGSVTNTITTQGGQYTIPAGYHSGSGKVTASFPNLVPDNIRKGATIGGIPGTYEDRFEYISGFIDTSGNVGITLDPIPKILIGSCQNVSTSKNGINLLFVAWFDVTYPLTSPAYSYMLEPSGNYMDTLNNINAIGSISENNLFPGIFRAEYYDSSTGELFVTTECEGSRVATDYSFTPIFRDGTGNRVYPSLSEHVQVFCYSVGSDRTQTEI